MELGCWELPHKTFNYCFCSVLLRLYVTMEKKYAVGDVLERMMWPKWTVISVHKLWLRSSVVAKRISAIVTWCQNWKSLKILQVTIFWFFLGGGYERVITKFWFFCHQFQYYLFITAMVRVHRLADNQLFYGKLPGKIFASKSSFVLWPEQIYFILFLYYYLLFIFTLFLFSY